MKITLLTNEYPPHIYGGAGVHVEYLTRELSSLNDGINDISVLCFGDQKAHSDNFRVEGINLNFSFPYRNGRHRKLLDTLFRNIMMVGSVKGADIVHCHTWYTHLAGCLVKQKFRVPPEKMTAISFFLS
jgi:glycosyltransferase involved in cell wall biosynthesis